MEVISSIYNSGYNIKKFYLGSQELNLAYLGNQVIYDEVIGDNDLNYILYEFYGSDTLPNTVEAPVKRAILKGRSLVNLLKVNKDDYRITINSNNWSVEDGYLKCISTTGWHTITDKFSSSIKPNTKYLIFVEIKENTLNIDINFDGYDTTLGTSAPFIKFAPNEVGTKKAIVTTISTLDSTKNGFFRMPINIPNNNSILKFRAMAIEYQDDMENEDIPYFEDIKSVKMPVLTTTGKNLFNPNQKINQGYFIDDTSGSDNPHTGYATTNYLKILPNTVYTNYYTNHIAFYDENKTFIRREPTWTNLNGAKVTSPSNAYYVRIQLEISNIPNGDYSEIGFICGDYANEPYKSNILTVNEDVTLRSNGDVYDELNLLTGRLTQRIDKNNEVLAQAVVKTVDLTIVDQGGKTINKLNSFNGTTHVSTEVAENSIYPTIAIEVATE